MAISNLLNTDLLLLQRPSVVPMQGRGSGELFKVSVHTIAEYVEEQFDTDIVQLKEDFAFLNQRLDFIENQILTSVNSTLLDHQLQIVKLEDLTEELVLTTEDLQEQINAALAKSRINFYYQLIDTTNPKSGQMAALDKDGGVADSLEKVTQLVYNIRDENDVVERFANVYDGEIIEVTALNNRMSAVTHRGVYHIDKIDFGFDTFTFDVTVRNASGTDMPFFNSADGILVRSDFYPVFTISEDEIDDKLDDYLPLRGGTISGNLILSQDLRLNKGSAGVIKYNNTFKLVDNNNLETFEVSQGAIQMKKNVIMNNNVITGLTQSTATDAAATVGYVNSKIDAQVVTQDDIFSPGDPVAATTENATQSKGFYFTGSALYFRI